MTKNERLTLAYAAFGSQIKAALVALETKFKAPLGSWVDGLKSRSREVDGKVKIFRPHVEEVPAHDALDDDRVAVDFRKALEDGRFSAVEVLRLVQTGLLVPAIQTEEAIRILQEKGGKPRAAYTVKVPKVNESWRPELRVLPLAKGAFEGLASSLKRTVDLEGTILKTAEGIETLPIEVFSGRQAGQVALGTRRRA